jgi:transposase
MMTAAMTTPPEVEVPSGPKRRTFTAEEKLRILDELDRAGRGEQGAILRREGLYSSHIVEWRRARRRGELGGLSPRKRGPAGKTPDERDRRIAQLEREKIKLQKRLVRAEALLDLQKKVSEVLGIHLPDPDESEKNS